MSAKLCTEDARRKSSLATNHIPITSQQAPSTTFADCGIAQFWLNMSGSHHVYRPTRVPDPTPKQP
jgi:hypothetical protein